MKLVLQTIPFIRFIIWIYLIYKIGFILGVGIIYLFYYIYDKVMLKYFKLTPLTAGDLTFMWNSHEETYNMMGIQVFDKLNIADIRKLLIERGIKKFKKLRSRVVYKYFNWWWEEQTDIDKVIEDVFSEPIRHDIINTREELVQYGVNELHERFDLTKQVPYKIIFVQNEKSPSEYRNCIIFKYDHVLTDGLGITSLILCLSDNYSIDLFPPSMQKTMSLLDRMKTVVALPYYSLYNLYRVLYGLNSGDTPFKLKKPLTGIPITSVSPVYDFALYNKIRNHLGITFNDLMMAVFSSSLKKFCQKHYTRVPEKVITITPISSRRLPKTIDHVQITNDSTAIACELNLHDDPIKESKAISEEFKVNLRNMAMSSVVKLLMDFTISYMPFYVAKYIIRTSTKNFDITYSNVPGPRQAVYYSGGKLLESIPVFTTGFGPAFIAINSYDGTFRITLVFDKCLEKDPRLLLDIFIKEMEYVRDNYDKKDK